MRKLQHADATLACELTPREHQITSLVSAGFSNKEIARWLNLTEATVKTHLHIIYQKARVQKPKCSCRTLQGQSSGQWTAPMTFVDAQPGQPGEAIKRVRSGA